MHISYIYVQASDIQSSLVLCWHIIINTGTMLRFYHMQTLQMLCFVKLVEDLDGFSPDVIAAQLPPAQRTMLLLKLPAVDVIKLECTSVV